LLQVSMLVREMLAGFFKVF